jgi:hypothetical protein
VTFLVLLCQLNVIANELRNMLGDASRQRRSSLMPGLHRGLRFVAALGGAMRYILSFPVVDD